MKKLYFPIFLIFFLNTILFAQEVKEKELPSSENKTAIMPNETQAVGDKVTIKDGTTILLEIENEGTAGSIFIPDAGEIASNTIFKLYNNDGLLYWGNDALGIAAAGVTKIDHLSDAINKGSSLFLGFGSGVDEQNQGENNGNTSIGIYSMFSNTLGYQNTVLGNEALYSNTIGNNNTSIGALALYNNTAGSFNTAYGNSALYNNTTGNINTANGDQALYNNVAGNHGVAIGAQSQFFVNNSNSSFENGNTSVGYHSLRGSFSPASNTGNYNSAFGYQVLSKNSTGERNTANGYQALYNNTTGSYNVVNGDHGLYSNSTGNSNVAIGNQALFSSVAGNHGVAIGAHSQFYAYNTNTSFVNTNTSVGYQSLMGSTIPSNNTGNSNSAYGYQTLYSNTSGTLNTAVGNSSLYNNQSGHFNTANGNSSLYNNESGKYNTANGSQALFNNTTGILNTAHGYQVLYFNTTGNNNTAVGNQAGPSSSNFSNTTALGNFARTDASNQVRIGNSSVTSIGGQVGWTALSDIRYKSNINENVAGLDFILGLRPITYNINIEHLADDLGENISIDENGNKITRELPSTELSSRNSKANILYTGFAAQEVEELSNRIGYNFSGIDKPQNENSTYGLRYAEFVVPIVKAMQEQQEIIKKLEERIRMLEGKM